jgi:hypothetical protein
VAPKANLAQTLGIPVPAALSKAVDLQIIDIDEVEIQLTANSEGTDEESTDYLQQGQWWRIERAVITSQSQNLVQITLYQGDDTTMPQRARDWAQIPAGQSAVAEYPNYLTILPTRCLTVAMQGANEGDNVFAAVTYQLVQKLVRRGGSS